MGNANLRQHATSATFTSRNPVLVAGERGFETDTECTKVGDGVTVWAGLPYSSGPAAYVPATAKGAASGVASLDAGAKIPSGQVPDLSGTYLPKGAATVGFYSAAPVARAAAIASPTSDALGTKAAIDAIRVALTNIGITL